MQAKTDRRTRARAREALVQSAACGAAAPRFSSQRVTVDDDDRRRRERIFDRELSTKKVAAAAAGDGRASERASYRQYRSRPSTNARAPASIHTAVSSRAQRFNHVSASLRAHAAIAGHLNERLIDNCHSSKNQQDYCIFKHTKSLSLQEYFSQVGL